jgi:hypothetical protein
LPDFPEDAAIAAVDSLNLDWDEQARTAAQQILTRFPDLNREQLIEALTEPDWRESIDGASMAWWMNMGWGTPQDIAERAATAVGLN